MNIPSENFGDIAVAEPGCPEQGQRDCGLYQFNGGRLGIFKGNAKFLEAEARVLASNQTDLRKRHWRTVRPTQRFVRR